MNTGEYHNTKLGTPNEMREMQIKKETLTFLRTAGGRDSKSSLGGMAYMSWGCKVKYTKYQ